MYNNIYLTYTVNHVPIKCELFYEVEVLGKHFVSSKTKGNESPYILAQWAGMRGRIRGKTL